MVVPTKLRDKVLKELHQGHPGIVKMKQIEEEEEEEEERSEDVATAPLTIPTPPSRGGEEATTHEEANMRRYPTRNRSKPE